MTLALDVIVGKPAMHVSSPTCSENSLPICNRELLTWTNLQSADYVSVHETVYMVQYL